MQHLKNLLEDLQVSQEALDGTVSQEVEYTFFAKVSDFAQFSKAQRSEVQEQWEFFCQPGDGNEGTVRIRAVDHKQFILATKLKVPNAIGKEEAELEVTADMFRHFRALAPKGTYRTRYIFPIENSQNVWEVDVFKNARGETVPWVKIDLEVANQSDPVPPLPIVTDEKIVEAPSARTDEQKQIIADLFDNQYALGGPNRDTWIATAATLTNPQDSVSDTTEEQQAATTDATEVPTAPSDDPVTKMQAQAAQGEADAAQIEDESKGTAGDQKPTEVQPDPETSQPAAPDVPVVDGSTPDQPAGDATAPAGTDTTDTTTDEDDETFDPDAEVPEEDTATA